MNTAIMTVMAIIAVMATLAFWKLMIWMASIAVIARIFQMAKVTVFPQMKNLLFFVNFPKNVYHRENLNVSVLKQG